MASLGEPDRRARTGIAGLDEILAGGLPRDRIYLVQGDAGSGKTTLGLQFLAEGARQGERSLLVTLSETRADLDAMARSHGWSLDGIEIFEMSALDQAAAVERENALFESSEFELQETTQMILERVGTSAPQRVVIDSLSELRLLAQSSLRYRRQLLGLKQHFSGARCTALFLDDQLDERREHQLSTLAHGVLRLEHAAPAYGEDRRRLRVVKLRGVKYCSGHHDFAIQTGGIAVFPRVRAAAHQRSFDAPPLSSGVPELDRLLGGGVDRGTSTLLMGPAGTGKSIIATQFALAAAERGQSAAIFTFDEGAATFFERTRRLGFDIDAHVSSGRIRLQQLDPAEMSPGEFARTAFSAVEQGASLIVIDSLNGYLTAMTDEKFLVAQLHELLSVFAARGVSSLLLMSQFGLMGHVETPVDLSYLSDTVLLLRYFEAGGRIRKAISALKRRSGSHEDTIRELIIERGGVRLGEPLTSFSHVLTGAPHFHGPLDALSGGP